ncbi:DUF115 domain-containing protein [Akkermansiaceae bacterium]|nr:DUF115 domain-containing protein [Akkermansiaceae bacterium]
MLSLKRILALNPRDITFTRIVNAIIRRVKWSYHLLIYFLPFGFSLKNRRKIEAIKDANKGKRCFILATGPSLKKVKFDMLKDEFLIGMNRGFLLEQEFKVLLDLLVCIDNKTQLEQFTADYDQINHIPTFYDFRLRRLFRKLPNRFFTLNCFSPRFMTDGSTIFGDGGSVTYNCIQLAYHLGFKEVYLLGKDHSYNTNAKSGTSVKVENTEGNHFSNNYYHRDQIYDAPDYLKEEFAYEIAFEHFKKNNRNIFDLTIGGNLEVFPKKNLSEIINEYDI